MTLAHMADSPHLLTLSPKCPSHLPEGASRQQRRGHPRACGSVWAVRTCTTVGTTTSNHFKRLDQMAPPVLSGQHCLWGRIAPRSIQLCVI